MVLAEWHAEQDAACTGSPVTTPAIGDTSRASSQPAQETLSGPDSDSPMEDCTSALVVVAKESSDWFDETKHATDLIDSSGPSTLPAVASTIPDTMVASGPPVPCDEEIRGLLGRLNVNGMRGTPKRRRILQFCKLLQVDVVLLQETHISCESDVHLWSLGVGRRPLCILWILRDCNFGVPKTVSLCGKSEERP
ncbi:hypothetical protein BSL78_10082 [Apostichopus japonicus]|uniref:Endonuclease/exonuclease/phosphatase domain-containing protein n=1 Tax=Stichopus japonicus TaxID=307972 RepID=A0A2G8KYG3_STIJA|nr:hypothetical protein BSL78_10082 [Apostichopus japonicus]